MTGQLLTTGHGTASAEELAARLRVAGVQQLVDVRVAPSSRRWPWFDRSAMERWLPDAGVAYRWEPRLGGHRPRVASSPDHALRNASFRAYAGWMREPDFREGLADVLATAARERTAVLCSESVWWRCHRRLVADAAVLLHDVEVQHLMPDGRLSPHRPTAGVRRVGDQLVYDVGEPAPSVTGSSASGGTSTAGPAAR